MCVGAFVYACVRCHLAAHLRVLHEREYVLWRRDQCLGEVLDEDTLAARSCIVTDLQLDVLAIVDEQVCQTNCSTVAGVRVYL